MQDLGVRPTEGLAGTPRFDRSSAERSSASGQRFQAAKYAAGFAAALAVLVLGAPSGVPMGAVPVV